MAPMSAAFCLLSTAVRRLKKQMARSPSGLPPRIFCSAELQQTARSSASSMLTVARQLLQFPVQTITQRILLLQETLELRTDKPLHLVAAQPETSRSHPQAAMAPQLLMVRLSCLLSTALA